MRIHINFLVPLIFAVFSTTFAYSENPKYSLEKLMIPSVDAGEIPSYFQDVIIEASDNNLWKLVEFYEGTPIDDIESVELIKVDSFPIQIFLKITGTFKSGCGEVGQIGKSFYTNIFSVVAYYKINRSPNEIDCSLGFVPFSKIIELPTYGLEAGEYEYELNGSFSGKFTLERDNWF